MLLYYNIKFQMDWNNFIKLKLSYDDPVRWNLNKRLVMLNMLGHRSTMKS